MGNPRSAEGYRKIRLGLEVLNKRKEAIMRKKRIIISIVVVICVLIGVFFIMRFGVIGRIYNALNKPVVQSQSGEDTQEDLIYETFLDKDGNEVVIEMEKTIGVDVDGNEVEFYVDTADPIIIYDYMYKGEIEKIEDNKIYFIVDKEMKEESLLYRKYKDVEDYQLVFDIDTYDLESGPHIGYNVRDFLIFDDEDFYSTGELEFLVGKYLRVQDCMFEDCYIGDRYKALVFYL